jgi:hypothetical protein
MKLLASHRLAVLAMALVFGVAIVATAEEAAAPTKPFNGKDTTGWKFRGDPAKSQWVVGTAKLDEKNPSALTVEPGGDELINKSRGVDIYTEQKFGDCILTVDVMVPKGSNSGIYLQGEYELQILDSFGHDKNPGMGDMGAIYSAAVPKNPVYKKPGEWQTFEIHFQAPKFDDAGKKTANAKFIKVVLNGVTIHENVEVKGGTGGQLGPETAKGPLMFQGDHGPVAFRNIEIKPLK